MTEEHPTVEGRWDILYRDYPEVYDEFAAVPKTPPIDLMRLFEFTGKTVADVGSGSGASTIALARVARRVIGVEIEDAMRAGRAAGARAGHRQCPVPQRGCASTAARRQFRRCRHRHNARHPPRRGFSRLRAGSTARDERRRHGYGGQRRTAVVWWGAGAHYPGTARREDDDDLLELDRILREEFGFEYLDVFQDQEYGSLDKIVRTYGFIHGRRAIQYLIEHNKTSIRWKFRIHWRRVGT